MIELLFSDSAAASLACAKQGGTGIAGTSVVITADSSGNVSSEPYEPKPYRGPTVDGSPDDIVSLWLMADIGDISSMPGSRFDLLEKIRQTYAEQYGYSPEENWAEQLIGYAMAMENRLRAAAQRGDPVRIWWSDAPAEACGFYWAMELLKESTGLVTSVKLPPHNPVKDGFASFSGTGELSPDWFPRLLTLERAVNPEERLVYAREWAALVRENAPLRAVVNGHVHSVPESFYDFALRRAIPESEYEVARVVGSAVINGPSGVSDWWYAWRLQMMIASGDVFVVTNGNTFYSSTIRQA